MIHLIGLKVWLAARHGMKLATLDEKIFHPAVVLVDQLKPLRGKREI